MNYKNSFWRNKRWRIAQWFELRWWKNYLRGKDKQEYLAWKKNYWLNILEKIKNELNAGSRNGDPAKTVASKTICDLGCGPAGIFIVFTENKVTAVDPLIDEYENQTLFFSKSDYHNTTFIKSTMEDFNPSVSKVKSANVTLSGVEGSYSGEFFDSAQHDIPSGTVPTFETDAPVEKFDLVFCMNAINHIHDIEKGFEKLNEVCAENGTVIFSIDAHNFSFFKYLSRLIPGDILHPHQYDLDEYKTFLEKQKMKIVKTELLKKEFFFNHYLMVVRK